MPSLPQWDLMSKHLKVYYVSAGFVEKYFSGTVPRYDIDSTGTSRPGRCSLDAAGALRLILHYLNSTMCEMSLQQIFALIPSTVSQYNNFSLVALLETLKGMDDTKIVYPYTAEEFKECNMLITNWHPHLTGAFGGLNDLNLLVQTLADEEIENATYNRWLSEHFIGY